MRVINEINTFIGVHVMVWVFFLMIILCFSGRAFSDPHSLQYLYMAVTPATHFPEFTAVILLERREIQYFNGNTSQLIPKMEWIKKHVNDAYWKHETEIMQEDQNQLSENLKKIMSFFNETTGHHTLQRLYGCEWYNNGTIRGYELYGFDGEDLISLDLETLTWIPDNKNIIKKLKVEDKQYIISRKDYLYIYCVEKSKGFANSSVKDPPEVQVFQQQQRSSFAELVCHATGFFPRAVNLTWQRDREKMENEVEVRETLPNQDGSFQKRIILRVLPEDLQKNNYTCVVQHSSLKEDLVLNVNKSEITLPLDESNKSHYYIWISIAVASVILFIIAVYCMKKYCANQENQADRDDAQREEIRLSSIQQEQDLPTENGLQNGTGAGNITNGHEEQKKLLNTDSIAQLET